MPTRPQLLPAVCCVFATACAGSPTELTVVSPEVAALRLVVWLLDGRGGAVVDAATSSPSGVESASNPAITVTLLTVSGDSEQVLLEPLLCTLSGGREVFCREFMVVMGQGDSVQKIVPHVQAADALLFTTRICSQEGCSPYSTGSGSVRLLSGDLEETMARARRWPGVRSVEYKAFGHIQGGSAGVRDFSATIRLQQGNTPMASNSVLESSTTDTIVVSYKQPSGDEFVIRCVVRDQRACERGY